MNIPEIGSKWSHDGGEWLCDVQIDCRSYLEREEGGPWFVIGVQDNRGFRFDVPDYLWPPDGYRNDADSSPPEAYQQVLRDLVQGFEMAFPEEFLNPPPNFVRVLAAAKALLAQDYGEVSP